MNSYHIYYIIVFFLSPTDTFVIMNDTIYIFFNKRIMTEEEKKIIRIAAHHGDYNHQNSLKHAKKVLDHHKETIDMVEIDFVYHQGNFVSSHDHETETILRGAYLIDWIRLVIFTYKKILWIDMKSNMFSLVSMITDWTKEESNALFKRLNKYHRETLNKYKMNLKNYIMISSQYEPFKKRFTMLNNELDKKWLLTMDFPYSNYYVWEYVLPNDLQSWNNESVQDKIIHFDFSDEGFISIDLKFFDYDIEYLFTLLKKNGTIKKGCYILLYPFKQDYEYRITSDKYHIIMMIDFVSDKAIHF